MPIFFSIPNEWNARLEAESLASRKKARAANYAWLNSPDKRLAYAGKWVFLADGDVVASGRSRLVVVRRGQISATRAVEKIVVKIGKDGAVIVPGA